MRSKPVQRKKENVLLGITRTSLSQVASMLQDKAIFLQKHNHVLFGKDFRDNLTKSLKAKKESIEAIADVSKSNSRKRSFREDECYQQRPNGGGGKKSDRTTMVHTFFSKNEPFYSNSQISRLVR